MRCSWCYLQENETIITLFLNLTVFVFFSSPHQNKYKEQYEKMKFRYTAIADTPLLIRSKKAYFQSSDVSSLTCKSKSRSQKQNSHKCFFIFADF